MEFGSKSSGENHGAGANETGKNHGAKVSETGENHCARENGTGKQDELGSGAGANMRNYMLARDRSRRPIHPPSRYGQADKYN